MVDAQLSMNCDCTDMVFCAWQLEEKAIEHTTKVFLLFVDLQKAYNSVPRSAMWLVLQKYGVLCEMIYLVGAFMIILKLKFLWLASLHRFRYAMLAPTQFLLYFNMVM